MNQLPEEEGVEEARRESNVIAIGGGVFCFGSIPAVLDAGRSNGNGGVSDGNGNGNGIEIGREREEDVGESDKGGRGETPRSNGGAREEDDERGEVDMERENAMSESENGGACRGSGMNRSGGVEEIEMSPGEQEAEGKGRSADKMVRTDALSLNASGAIIDRSLRSGRESAMNVERPACEVVQSVEPGAEDSNLVPEVNGSMCGDAQSKALDERSIDIGSVASEVADQDCGRIESSTVNEDGELRVKCRPRPLPPVVTSADERSIALSWVGCPEEVSYYLDYACSEVSMVQKKDRNSIATGRELGHKWTSIFCGDDRSYKVYDLKPGTSYSFRLRVTPIVVSPSATLPSPSLSDIAIFCTKPAAPSPPLELVLVNRARTSLKVKWTKPTETGGLPLEYVVEMNPPPGKDSVNGVYPSTLDEFVGVYNGKEEAVKVTRLLPGTLYKFRVLAVNSVGHSEFSKVYSFQTAASVPAAPEAPTLVTATATSMIVEWQEPSNSGSPITEYTLEHDDGDSGPFVTAYTGRQLCYTMEGLKSGHVYRVRVMAHNEKGKGPFSRPGELLTNFASPSPPAPPSIRERSTTIITISWGPSERDGGSPITAYEVEMKRFMRNNWTAVMYYGSCTTYTVTGLCPGELIGVRVRAVNLMGKSGWCSEARFGTLPGLPEAPSDPVAVDVGSRSIVLEWCPPVHDGGSQIVCYRLEAIIRKEDATSIGSVQDEESRVLAVYRSEKCRFKISGLEPGASYCFQVQAVNKLGAGPYSGLSVLTTLSGPPAAPEPPVAARKASANSISLRWSPPCSNGAPIELYSLQMVVLGYGEKCISGCDDSTTSGCDIQGGDISSLANQRVHSDSFSPFSDGPPHSPSHSTSSDSSRGTSTWESEKSSQKNRTSPSYAGTSEDEHDVHGVQYKRSVDGQVTLFRPFDLGLIINGARSNVALCDAYSGPSTAYTVNKLQPHTSYAFRLQARNAAGLSEFSAFSIMMTSPAAPCAPCPPVVIEETSSSLTIRWEVPEQDNGSPVFRFTLEMLKVEFDGEGMLPKERSSQVLSNQKKSSKKKMTKKEAIVLQTSVWNPVYDGSGLRHEVSDLLPGKKYTFRVIAHNLLGMSPPSLVTEATTLPSAPGAPAPPTFSRVTPTSVHIKWSSPTRTNGDPVRSYMLMMDDGQGGPLAKVHVGGSTSYKAMKLQPASRYRVAVQSFNNFGAGELSDIAVIELPMAPPPAPSTPKVDFPIEGGQAPLVLVNKPRPSLLEFMEVVNSFKQVSRNVQQPWSLQIRRWLSGIGVSVTLLAAIIANR